MINEEQAKTVRRIYREFLEGWTPSEISRRLNKEGVPGVHGEAKWHSCTITRMLQNEKHVGDLLMQKTYTADFLTKTQEENKGKLEQYFIKDDHECCPYVNTNAPPQKARKMGVSWDMCFAHPSSQMAKRLHIGEL